MKSAKMIAHTEASNARFARMTPARQRVQIALDAIAFLEVGAVNARNGRYFDLRNSDADMETFKNPNGSFRDTLGKFDMSGCNVCAKGVMFMCTIARRNEVSNEVARTFVNHNGGDIWVGSKMSEALGGVFSPQQLRLMEVEFEGRDVEYNVASDKAWPNKPNMQSITPVMQLGSLPQAKDRLIVIMRNIIDGEGEFKPVPVTIDTLTLYKRGQLPAWKSPRRRRSLVTVKVTADHIEKGDVTDPVKHPVALALHSAGLRRWNVGGADFVIGKVMGNFTKRKPFPDSVKQFVTFLDNGGAKIEAKPFEFEVAL